MLKQSILRHSIVVTQTDRLVCSWDRVCQHLCAVVFEPVINSLFTRLVWHRAPREQLVLCVQYK